MVWFKDSFDRLINSEHIAQITTDGQSVTAHYIQPYEDRSDFFYEDNLFEGLEPDDAEAFFAWLTRTLNAEQ